MQEKPEMRVKFPAVGVLPVIPNVSFETLAPYFVGSSKYLALATCAGASAA